MQNLLMVKKAPSSLLFNSNKCMHNRFMANLKVDIDDWYITQKHQCGSEKTNRQKQKKKCLAWNKNTNKKTSKRKKNNMLPNLNK